MKSEGRRERLTEAAELADSVEQIARFSGINLASKIAELDFNVIGLDKVQVAEWLHNAPIEPIQRQYV